MRALAKGIAAATGFGAVITASILVPQFEGVELEPYRDVAGVWTVCYGHTKDVSPGERRSSAECADLLKDDLYEAADAVDRLVKVKIPESTRAALISFVYNVGQGAFARSTLLKRLNQGKLIEACNELSRWVHANGKRLRGLVKRREAERQLCLEDLQDGLRTGVGAIDVFDPWELDVPWVTDTHRHVVNL